jgi:hypothetical protein
MEQFTNTYTSKQLIKRQKALAKRGDLIPEAPLEIRAEEEVVG